ncbi:hypothetical protein [Lentibacillus jeotgali]|nr:hypothetical protein [Lentibacillus jeotgali]
MLQKAYRPTVKRDGGAHLWAALSSAILKSLMLYQIEQEYGTKHM